MTAPWPVSAVHPLPVIATPAHRQTLEATPPAHHSLPPTPEAGRYEPPLNYDQLVRRCLGKIELAERLLASFCGRFPAELAQLEACFTAGDGERVTRLAHQLTGAAANLSALDLQAVTGRLEAAARAGRHADVAAQLAEVRRAWETFQSFRASLSPVGKQPACAPHSDHSSEDIRPCAY